MIYLLSSYRKYRIYYQIPQRLYQMKKHPFALKYISCKSIGYYYYFWFFTQIKDGARVEGWQETNMGRR